MANARLNQILAVEKGTKNRVNEKLTVIYKTFQKPDLFTGHVKPSWIQNRPGALGYKPRAVLCIRGGFGRHADLRSLCLKGREGSTPFVCTVCRSMGRSEGRNKDSKTLEESSILSRPAAGQPEMALGAHNPR